MARADRRAAIPVPRDERSHIVTVRPRNAIVAAATRIGRAIPNANGGYSMPFRVLNEAWMQEAWRQYDASPELHFATQWLANSTSRCRFTVVEVEPDGTIGPVTTDPAVLALVDGLVNIPATQHMMIQGLATNLMIAGSAYVIATPNADGVWDDWMVLSNQEISLSPLGALSVNRGNGNPFTVDTGTALVIRVHRPHPRRFHESDSPTRAALPVLRELEELSKYLFATINSRLAGAGILALPSEMTFEAPPGEEGEESDDFFQALADGMITPIEDMSNPAALVPFVIKAPGDTIGNIKWIERPGASLPPEIQALRTDAIGRLALTLDIDVKNLQGSANANHWGEWAIEEQSIKFHIEPQMILMCNSLTVGFLQPSLEAAGLDPDKYAIWYDASDLINRPSRGTDAKDLYDRDELSGAALRDATGFSEFDAPTGQELCARQLLKFIALAPQVADQLLPEMIRLLGLEKCGVDPTKLVALPNPTGTPPQDGPPAPNHNPQGLPEQPKPPGLPPRQDGTPGEPNNGGAPRKP